MKATHKYLAWIAVCVLALSGCSSGSSTASTEETQKMSVADAEGVLTDETASETTADGETEETEEVTVDFSLGLTEDGQLDGLTASDYVTLPEYKSVTLSASTLEVTDEQLQSEIDDLLSDYAETNQVTDREVADGDTVNIDYVGHLGSADGEEFDGGSTDGSGTDVTIGETEYIDDFLDQLIGHKPGETINVEVTFPSPYAYNTDLSGKDAVFVTTINYIEETVTPELTDDFVTLNLADDGYTSAEDVRTKLTENLEKSHQYDAVWDFLNENCTISSIPEDLTNSLLDIYVDYLKQTATNYGISFEDYLSYYSLDSEEDLREEYKESAESVAKQYIIAQAISDTESLEVTDEDMQEYFDGDDMLDEYREFYGDGYVKMQVRISKIVDLIMETAKTE